jgi:diguanylate cyclase (GGDEF)-like protein
LAERDVAVTGLDAGDAQRLEAIAATLEHYANLNFDSRAPVGPIGDLVDAVAAGVNFLGEELAASFAEIEQRVAERTTALEATSEELRRLALHDQLTGLANRRLFFERLAQRRLTAERRRQPYAVIFCDLDDFKGVNDSLGHAYGDLLLVEAAERIRASLRAGDSAARVGGDEFLVLLDQIDGADGARGVAMRLAATLALPYQVDDHEVRLSASVGVALADERFDSVDALVNAADTAMYRAKRTGLGRCVLFGDSD